MLRQGQSQQEPGRVQWGAVCSELCLNSVPLCWRQGEDVGGDTVVSLVKGDSLNTQSEPEETVKKKKSEALNIRGVLLHVMGDALGSVVVVVTAIIFYVLPLKREEPCNWQCYIDPSLTIVMVVIILTSTFPLIKETAVILLQMVPPGIDMEALMSKLSVVPGVSGVHEVHVWELVSEKAIATLHGKDGLQPLHRSPGLDPQDASELVTVDLSQVREAFVCLEPSSSVRLPRMPWLSGAPAAASALGVAGWPRARGPSPQTNTVANGSSCSIR
ncbi:Zinc transporter 10 [Fukomys damarensis]|uniref:Zinc transporter 10 n=1 Tax=Fukomys damarensis TaxID=885580 RepID=A0A091D309_FUKDA|nr:Zinc transporter 10 [Fukomys damarensis]